MRGNGTGDRLRLRRPGPALPTLTLCLALLLAGCLYESALRTPRPPTPTPTPRPTPTPTPVPLRIAYPTAAPTPTPSPTPIPTPTPTPSPTPVIELRGAGQLLYIGALGRSGIVSVNADGSDRRLLAEGEYTAIAWSPDGRRFAAVSYPPSYFPQPQASRRPSQVDLYTAEGGLIRRFTGDGYVAAQPVWSADSRRVAFGEYAVPPGEAAGGRGPAVTWLLDEDGATKVALGARTRPLWWSARGRLAVAVAHDDGQRGQDERYEDDVWTVDAAGGDARKLAGAEVQPLGWSPDGAALYAYGDFQPATYPDGRAFPAPTSLLAIDADTGRPRSLVTVERLAAQLTPDANSASPVERRLASVLPAPDGAHFALWLPPASRGNLVGTLVVVDAAGQVVWEERNARDVRFALRAVWSPDGTRLAQHTANSLRVLTLATGDLFTVSDNLSLNSTIPKWSPDGRWIVFSQDGRLVIASSGPPARSWPLGTLDHSRGFLSLSWRPRTEP